MISDPISTVLDPIGNMTNIINNITENTSQNDINIDTKIGGGAILARSITDIFAGNSSMQILKNGVSQIENTSDPKKDKSLFIFPKTIVELDYKDQTSRTITNASIKNDIIVVDTTNVINVRISTLNDSEAELIFEAFSADKNADKDENTNYIMILLIFSIISILYFLLF